MVVDGQLFSAMGYELDGTTNQDPILGIIVINPTFDSISEMKQALQNFDAEHEYVGGGVASYSTKSGTNELHGDAFEYLQLNTPGFTTLAANPFVGLPAALYRQNQFGGSIGGPHQEEQAVLLWRCPIEPGSAGRIAGHQRARRVEPYRQFQRLAGLQPAITRSTIPPAAIRLRVLAGRRYPGNIIPNQPISVRRRRPFSSIFRCQTSQQIAGAPFVNNYAVNGDVAITGNQWNTREDYYLNDKNTIFGRYSYAGYTEQAPGAFGLEAGGPNFGHYSGNSRRVEPESGARMDLHDQPDHDQRVPLRLDEISRL